MIGDPGGESVVLSFPIWRLLQVVMLPPYRWRTLYSISDPFFLKRSPGYVFVYVMMWPATPTAPRPPQAYDKVVKHLNNFDSNKWTKRSAGRNVRAVTSMGSRGRLIRTSVLSTAEVILYVEPTMEYQVGVFAVCAAVFVYAFLRRYGKLSPIEDIPGPVNPSWIFGTSRRANLATFTSSRSPIALNLEVLKDISGIFSLEKLEQRIRGSSRILGTSSVGMVPLGCASPLIERGSTLCIRTPD